MTFFLLVLAATTFTDLGIFTFFYAWAPCDEQELCGPLQLKLILLTVKHCAHILLISRVNYGRMGQVAFLLLCFLGQNMTFERMLSLDFTGTRQLKSFLGSGFRLHFWHYCTIICD
jgi:hypothetical protein